MVFGGRLRERSLLALLSAHYGSLLRRDWYYSPEPPHFFDHRIGAFGFLTGKYDGFSYYRGYYAAELVRAGDVVLDIGCGDGFFAKRFFAPKCSHVDAVDIDATAIAHARHYNAAPNISYIKLDAIAQPFPRDQYDVVVLDGTLGHMSADTTTRLLQKIGAALTAEGAFAGSESLGQEGDDHLQFFETLDDLRSTLSPAFDYVQVREVHYAIPSGLLRREAFWRCANNPTRLAAAAWQSLPARDY